MLERTIGENIMTNQKFITTDDNGNNWYEFEGNEYGVTPEGRVIDCDGIPLDTVLSTENTRIIEALCTSTHN